MRQAVILVGGRGTRLGAAAQDTPKPLLPIAGDVRFLDYLLQNVARHGIEDIVLLAGHLGEQVEARYSGRNVAGAAISVIREPAPAGTAGALLHARDRLDDVFLMSNGDSFLDMNYLALAAAMRPSDMGALALRRVEDASRYGRVDAKDGRVAGFHEKDASWNGPALISGGVYALRRDVLARIERTPASIETDIFPALAAAGALACVTSDGFFIDIGLPETLAEGRQSLPARMRRMAVFFDRDGTLTLDHGYTHKPKDLQFLPDAVEAIRACNDSGALAIVVTNQAGVARGFYGEAEVDAFHDHLQQTLRRDGVHVDAFYHCPFHKDGVTPEYTSEDHPDRKPNSGMIRRAMLDWPIDASRSTIVGDHDHDVEAGRGAGVAGKKVAPGELLGAVRAALVRGLAPLPPQHHQHAIRELKARAAAAKSWLYDVALPLWWERGFDHENGCFFERMNQDGSPLRMPRRIRVQARQTFVYAMAGKLGWQGPWREAVEAGASVLTERGLQSEGGTLHLLDDAGVPIDFRRDLYDVAFVIFALAHAGAALERRDLVAAGERLADWTFANWSHPKGGLLEGDITPTPPRRQNPHMHMLEALIALHEAGGDRRQLVRAAGIVQLLRTRFVNPRWGALLEHFDDLWSPIAGDQGRISEPGHQFEWAWLLDRYQRHSGEDVTAIAHRLYAHGETYGVTPAGVTIDEVWADGAMRTPTSRFWPHTERLKANIIRVEKQFDPSAALKATESFDVLMRYCDTPAPGLWRDRMLADGSFIDEPALASSFYHAMMSMSELIRVADTL